MKRREKVERNEQQKSCHDGVYKDEHEQNSNQSFGCLIRYVKMMEESGKY